MFFFLKLTADRSPLWAPAADQVLLFDWIAGSRQVNLLLSELGCWEIGLTLNQY